MVNFKTLETLLTQVYPEQMYLVDRLVPEAGITILSGSPGVFKTYNLLQIAMCLANGEPYLGRFATQQTNVLIIDKENGDFLLTKRLFELGADPELPIFFTENMQFELTDDSVTEMVEKCIELDIKLVIIDSLIRVHSSEENSSKEMSQVFNRLRRFTEAGIAVLVTQHHRKQGANGFGNMREMIRGSSDIPAASDSNISIVRKDKGDTSYLVFHQTKQRYDRELAPFEVEVIADEDANTVCFEYVGESESRADISETLAKEATIKALAETWPLNQKELREKLTSNKVKINEHKLRSYLTLWIEQGLLAPPKKGSGSTKLYQLNEVEGDE